jgi:integrase
MRLDATRIAALATERKPYYVTDLYAKTPGLQLRVGAGGVKSWSLRYRLGGRMARLSLGKHPAIDVAEARTLAKAALKKVAAGKDPAAEKIERREAETVADFAETFITEQKKKLKRWRGVESRLRNDVLPRWKHRLMRDITRRDVRLLVEDIAARPAPISANRCRALLSKFFKVAIAHEIVESNPVVGTSRPGTERSRDRVLTDDEIRQFWTACDALPLEMAAAWKLRLLTAQRATEVHDMVWSEIDLDGGWWTIPAERSKNKLSHRVWLNAPALRLLRDLRKQEDARLEREATRTEKDARTEKNARKAQPEAPPYVLRNARGKKQQAAAAATFKLRDFTGHDLRRTAASLMTGSGTPRLVVSKILNHVESGVTRVYDRHSYDAEKRMALDAWARTLTAIIEAKKKPEGANVVAFTRP